MLSFSSSRSLSSCFSILQSYCPAETWILGLTTGKIIVNFAPCPSSLLEPSIQPPWASIMALLMYNPSPVPPSFPVLGPFLLANFSNNLGSTCSLIPGPLSLMTTSTTSPLLESLVSIPITPLFVNLMALPLKLPSTWFSLDLSAFMIRLSEFLALARFLQVHLTLAQSVQHWHYLKQFH